MTGRAAKGFPAAQCFLRYNFLPGNFSEFMDDFNLFVGRISHAEGNHLFSLIKYFFKYCKTSSCGTRRLYLLNTLPSMNRFLKGWTTVYTRSHTVFSLGKTNFSLVRSYFLFQFQLFSRWVQTVFSFQLIYFLFGFRKSKSSQYQHVYGNKLWW